MDDIDAEISRLNEIINSRVDEFKNQIKTAEEQIERLNKKRIAFQTGAASEEKANQAAPQINEEKAENAACSADAKQEAAETKQEEANEETKSPPAEEKKIEGETKEHEKELKNPFVTFKNVRGINLSRAFKWISSHEVVGAALILLVVSAVIVYKNFLLYKFSLESSSISNTLILFSFFGLTIGIFWKLFQKHEPETA